MKHSEHLDDLLTRSLFNGITPGEKAFLLQWLNASAANRQYYEALKNTWELMAVKKTIDDINVEDEWTHFKACIDNDADPTAEVIALAGQRPKKNIVYKWLAATVAAASVIILMGIGLHWWSNKKTGSPVVVAPTPKATPAFITRFETNTSVNPKQIVLQDGSIVLLDPSGELSWQEPFIGNRRDIHLTGRAGFKVTKDKTKPFTVFSGDLATTALGTQFIVSAFPGSAHISVRLHEGKVVVKAADSLQPKLKKAYYLLPGEELIYDNNRYTARVQRFTSDTTAAKSKTNTENKNNDEPVLPKGEKESWYMFNNQPLAQVFGQLQELFGVAIAYSEKDVEKMYFIGRFSKKDSLSHILKQIADLNNLSVTRQNNKYVIGHK